jgi:RNA polymerase sigma-70 factor (ECF subfamily)
LLNPVYADCERWAYSLAQDRVDAEDVLSESILAALRGFHQLKDDSAFKQWMFRVIRNTFRQSLRSGRRWPEAMDPAELPTGAERDTDWAEREDRSRTVREALARLSPEQREALVLFHVHGLSVQEVCEVLGKKGNAVRVLLHRARQRLKELMQDDG